MNLNWYQRLWKALRGEVATVPIWMIAFYFVVSRLLMILMAVLSMKIIRPGAFRTPPIWLAPLRVGTRLYT